MYPDQSLYPSNSGPEMTHRINKTLERASQIEQSEGETKHDWFVPIVADAEAGFGGPLNCFEIMKAYIEAGAAGVHFEDQLASEKKCGHLGGKVIKNQNLNLNFKYKLLFSKKISGADPKQCPFAKSERSSFGGGRLRSSDRNRESNRCGVSDTFDFGCR